MGWRSHHPKLCNSKLLELLYCMCIPFVAHQVCSNNSTLHYSFLLYIHTHTYVLISLQTAKLHIIHLFINSPFSQSLVFIPNITPGCFKLLLLFPSKKEAWSYRNMGKLCGGLVLREWEWLCFLSIAAQLKLKLKILQLGWITQTLKFTSAIAKWWV